MIYKNMNICTIISAIQKSIKDNRDLAISNALTFNEKFQLFKFFDLTNHSKTQASFVECLPKKIIDIEAGLSQHRWAFLTNKNEMNISLDTGFRINYFNRHDPTLSVKYSSLPTWLIQSLIDHQFDPSDFVSSDSKFELEPKDNYFYHALFQSFVKEWKFQDPAFQTHFINNFKLQILQEFCCSGHQKIANVSKNCMFSSDDFRMAMRQDQYTTTAALVLLQNVFNFNMIILEGAHNCSDNSVTTKCSVFPVTNEPHQCVFPYLILIKKEVSSFSILTTSGNNEHVPTEEYPLWFMSTNGSFISALINFSNTNVQMPLNLELKNMKLDQLSLVLTVLGKNSAKLDGRRKSKSEIIDDILNHSFTDIQIARIKSIT